MLVTRLPNTEAREMEIHHFAPLTIAMSGRRANSLFQHDCPRTLCHSRMDAAQLLWCTSVTLDLMLLFPCRRVIDTEDNLESLPDATGQTKSGFTWAKVRFIADESNFYFVGESVFSFTRNNTLHNWYTHTHLKKIVLHVARVCMSPPLKVYVKSWQTLMGLLRFSGLALTLGRC